MTQINDKPWISVESSSLTRLKYSIDKMELLVEFKGGAQYLYQNIPSDLFLGLMTADSIGSAFHKLIKTQPASYPYEKIAA